jgi:hypothetical protein
MTYSPAPIDTSDVALPDGLSVLTERLAEHVHDTWARRRMAEGWTHGPTRDDDAKTHPGLVPYDALPEAEKTYDRQTALETLKALRVLGHDIVPSKPAANHGGAK